MFTHAILLILILCLFAWSIGYIHDGRQAGAEQASPHNNIVMSCLFNAGKKILGGFAIWKLIFSLVSSLIILATLRPCQIMPLTVRSYIRQHSKLSLVLYYDMPVNKDQISCSCRYLLRKEVSSISGAVQLIHTPVLPTSPVPAGGIACKVCSVLISSLVLLISIHRCLLQNSDDQSAVQMIIHGCFCLLRNLQINILF